MADANIVIKATDKYSDVIKKMIDVTHGFDKNVEHLTGELEALSKTKTEVALETEKARLTMKEAQKQYAATGDEADRLKMALAGQNYEGWRRNLNEVNKTLKQTEKAIQAVTKEVKEGKTAGSGLGAGVKTLTNALAASGLNDIVQDLLLDGFNAAAASMGGAAQGNYFSGALSGISSGIAAGAAMGPYGAAIGGLAGSVLGLASGGIQNAQERDASRIDYYNGLYDTVTANTTESLLAGKTLAKKRENTKISFTTLLGDEDTADSFLGDVLNTANTTPFLYDDLVDISKTLLSFGTAVEDVIPTLTAVGDAGAALGLSTADIGTVATNIGRMQSSDRATREYLDQLNDRGLSVYQWLAEDQSRQTGQEVSVGNVLDQISKGDLSGQYVSDVILSKFQGLYSGQMNILSNATGGLESTLQGARENIEAAGGAAYNGLRKEAYRADIAAYDGELGKALSEVSAAGGEAKAYGENMEDQYLREALSAVLLGEKPTLYEGRDAENLEGLRQSYAEAYATYKDPNADKEAQMQAANKMESLRELAEALAQAAYDSSEWSKNLHDAEMSEIEAINRLTARMDAATRAWETESARSKGILSTLWDEIYKVTNPEGETSGADRFESKQAAATAVGYDDAIMEAMGYYSKKPTDGKAHAFGLKYVPYDGYPAILHQGERILTAAESRSMDSGPIPMDKRFEAMARNEEPSGWGMANILDSYWHSHAFGLKTAPFDGYPALLHQGERVLTAEETHSMDSGTPPMSKIYGAAVASGDADGGAALERRLMGGAALSFSKIYETEATDGNTGGMASAAEKVRLLENGPPPMSKVYETAASRGDADGGAALGRRLTGSMSPSFSMIYEASGPGGNPGGIGMAADGLSMDSGNLAADIFPLPDVTAAISREASRPASEPAARTGAGSAAPTPVNVEITVTGNTVRSEDDLDELVERFAEAIQEKATLFGG